MDALPEPKYMLMDTDGCVQAFKLSYEDAVAHAQIVCRGAGGSLPYGWFLYRIDAEERFVVKADGSLFLYHDDGPAADYCPALPKA